VAFKHTAAEPILLAVEGRRKSMTPEREFESANPGEE
jgi:hypothetical protein